MAWEGLGEEELRLFLAESRELLDGLEADLLAAEGEGADADRVARLFRYAHTLKGSSATAGVEPMARLAHAMEAVLERVRAGEEGLSPPVVGSLLAAVDLLREMLAALAAGEPLPAVPGGLLAQLEARSGTGEDGAAAAPAVASPPAAGTTAVHVTFDPSCPMPAVRALQVLLALEPLGSVVASDPPAAAIEAGQVGSRLTVWLAGQPDPGALREAVAAVPDVDGVAVVPPAAADGSGTPAARRAGSTARAAEDRTIRVDVALMDRLMNLVGELVIDRGRLARIGSQLAERPGVHDVAEELALVVGHLARVTGALQEAVLKARMLPIERVFRRFPRMVRDLAQQLGKRVELEMVGEETELDRALLEAIGDPLVHLVRNALDHGIEPPEERRQAGKPEVGRLRLVAVPEGDRVVVTVEDDGRGIDAERVRRAAVARGLLSPERARDLPDHEVIQLIFAPGFSTAEQVTDVSGRGVGMDVVRRNIEEVGGRIDVETRPGRGTAIRLTLPLTLATIRALLVEVAGETLALPLAATAEVLRVGEGDVASLRGRPATRVRGRVVPLLWLRRFYEPGYRPPKRPGPCVAVLVHHKGDLVGLVVDRLLGEQEVVVKGLGEFLGRLAGLSGVTILGDGSPALIVDVPALIPLLAAEDDGPGDPLPAACAGEAGG